MKIREIQNRYKLWRKWRKISKSDYPLKYAGQSDIFIKYGTPLRRIKGLKAQAGAGRYLTPDNIERLINRKLVEKR